MCNLAIDIPVLYIIMNIEHYNNEEKETRNLTTIKYIEWFD